LTKTLDSFFAIFGKPLFSFGKKMEKLGKFVSFNLFLIPLYFKPPFRIKETFKEIEQIGVYSFPVIALTAIFTGLVEAVQLYNGFHQFGAEAFMGYTIFVSITKELAPVFGALMLISRAISSMAAELGTMRVTEQIDAIDTLGVNSKKYLVIPKIIATTISLPILIITFDFLANFSAYLISTNMLGINQAEYTNVIMTLLKFSDIATGIIKAFVFGFLISSIGTYIGYNTKGGAKGVGISTTLAVVYSAVTVFAANYILSTIFLYIGW
jgi:phospholipid/cholesterol/gamma-HCH transport system permease protein